MPKSILERKAPPIDWIHAAILERRIAYGYDLHKMAAIAGVSYEYIRKFYNKRTSDWPQDALRNVCDAFGIKVIPVVDGSSPEGVRM